MTANIFKINQSGLMALASHPKEIINGRMNGHRYTAKIAIPNYVQNITRYYNGWVPNGLIKLSQRVSIPMDFQHFGFICEFEKPIELRMFDKDLCLEPNAKEILQKFGPIIIKNAYLDVHGRSVGHRNRFPHLNFHVDRSANQPTPYSFFTRDPFDPEQTKPRTSSTLFIANIVPYLQSLKEANSHGHKVSELNGSYTIFSNENINDVLNNIILEHAWDEPQGTGEISMLDNRSVYHASYYKNKHAKGYRIGVRYLK